MNAKTNSGQRIPFSQTLIRGAIGKEYVIKHYTYGAVKTRYPDMRRVIPSVKQTIKRNLFKKAVAYAKRILKDPEKKKFWIKQVLKKHRIFNVIIRHYMLREKTKKKIDILTGEKLINSVFGKGLLNKSILIYPGMNKLTIRSEDG